MDYEVVIAGASFAGLSVASHLSGRILLIDRADIGAHQTSTIIGEINKVEGTKQAHLEAYGQPPDPEQLADELETPVERLQAIERVPRQIASLDEPVGDDGNELFVEFIEDHHAPSPSEQGFEELLRRDLDRSLSRLSDKERRILELRYGLVDGKSKTLREVGKIVGLSGERVRQIELKVLERLKHPDEMRWHFQR
ncbi:MAG: sigma-70 family RNA polymerase sigma factor [Candidatus Bipolaricaulia bacterium]